MNSELDEWNAGLPIHVVDTETYRIGPGAVAPKLVCYSEAWYKYGKIQTDLTSTVDPNAEQKLADMLAPGGSQLVFHNASYDLAVIGEFYPDLVPLIWQKLALGEISDTKIREQLLNLSTFGRLTEMPLPDGSTQRILYSLGDLVMLHFGIDVSADKKGDDIWRLNYDKLDGLPAASYPLDASRYAKEDSEHTLLLYGHQEDRIQSMSSYASCSTATFHTAADYALFQITMEGMYLDPEAFWALHAEYQAQLTPEKLAPLVTSGLMVPALPPLPYKRVETKATDQLAEWLDISPDDVDWNKLDDGLRRSLIECNFPFKKPETATMKKAPTAHRIVALKLRKETRRPLRVLLNRSLETLEALAERWDVKLVRTDTGGICADKEVRAELAPVDEKEPGEDKSPMVCFDDRERIQKIITTELPRMCWEGKPAEKVHFPYKVLLETARTSSGASDLYPSANGQNVDPRARPVFVPQEGYVLCSSDYKALELVCCAQTTYDLFGKSVHRDKINAGYDLHSFLGGQIAANLDHDFDVRPFTARGPQDAAYHAMLKLKKDDPAKFKLYRGRLGKVAGLGFSSGLGSRTLVHHAKKAPYFIDLEELALGMLDQLEPSGIVFYYAKKLYGMKSEAFEWNRELAGIALADRLRQIWLETYPEMVEYFEWVKKQGDEYNPKIYLGKEDEDGREGLCYTTPMGMHRAACTYTAVANGKALQSPGAEGFKHAIIDLQRACKDPSLDSILREFKTRFVNEIHDETITELVEWFAHDLAMEVKGIMENGMKKVITDVDVEVEPCLMRRWYKFAEGVYDENGVLQVWEPKE